MARRASGGRRAAARLVQAGDPLYRSSALALPRVAALSSAFHEDDVLHSIRHSEFVASSRDNARPRFPAKRVAVHAKLTGRKPYLSALQMFAPRRVLFCLRRRIRREVMFALGKNGRNGGRRYRRSQESQYAC